MSKTMFTYSALRATARFGIPRLGLRSRFLQFLVHRLVTHSRYTSAIYETSFVTLGLIQASRPNRTTLSWDRFRVCV